MNSPIVENADDSETECPDEYKDIFTTKNWIFEKKFTNSEVAIKYLKSQQLWDIDQKKCCAVVGGYKAMYRCTSIGDADVQCSAAKCIFFPNTSSEVLIFRSDRGHEHAVEDSKNCLDTLNEKTNARLKQLVELKMEQNVIIKQLEIEGFQFTAQQFQNAITKLSQTNDASSSDNDWTLEEKFDSVEEVKQYVQSQKNWSWAPKIPSDCGTRWYYCCNVPHCAAKIFYTHNQSTGEVLLYRNNLPHTHDLIPSTSEAELTEKSGLDNLQIESLDENVPTNSESVSCETRPIDKTKFKLQMSFANIEIAEEHLRQITVWSKYTKVMSRGGLREYYCCNLVNEKGQPCPAQIYLLHSNNSGKIRLYRNIKQHTHLNLVPKDNPIIETNELISADNEEIILNYNDCDNIIMDEVPTNELIGEEIIIGDFVDETQFAIEVNGDEWMFQKKFSSHQQALKYLGDTFMIFVNKQEVPLGGYQEYYRCGLIMNAVADESCPVTSYIEYLDEASDVFLYKNMLTRHTHDDVLPLSSGQPAKKMKYTGTTGKSLSGRGFNLKTIEKWLQLLAFVPGHDDDKPFCANYTIDQQNQIFQCFITTKRLLKIAMESRVVHADFKCSLSWQTQNILIIGTSDMDQVFHSFGIVITPTKTERDYEFAFTSLNNAIQLCFECDFKPEMLISNSKSTIQNAFVLVYGTPQSKLITCSNYMLSEITSSLKIIVPSEITRNEIICDIEKIQTVPSPEIFLEAIVLFVKKWGTTQQKFIDYFKAKWIQKNTNWYIGVSHYIPSTNDVLVLEYQRIANEYNIKHNQSFAILKSFVEHVVDTWSTAYETKSKTFARKPTISIPLYDEAGQWNAMQPQIDIEEIDTDTTYYYVPSESVIISPEKLAKYKSKFHQNLTEFFDIQFSFWEMKQIKDTDITCSCPYFFRHYICKHSLGMAIALNLYRYPTDTVAEDDPDLKKEEEDEESDGEVILS